MAIRITPKEGSALQPLRGGVPFGPPVIADGGQSFDIDKFGPGPGFEQEYIRLANEAEQKKKQQEISEATPEHKQFVEERAQRRAVIERGVVSVAIPTTPGASVDTPVSTKVDVSVLLNSPEFQLLSSDDQAIVRQVFEGVANNDVKKALEFANALKIAEQQNDPFFSSLLRSASDAIQRGFVSRGSEEAFKEEQLRNNLSDLREQVANQQEFLSLEESNVLRGIERQFEQALDTTRQNLAATGFTQSSRRAKKEALLGAEREDITESATRGFAFEQQKLATGLETGERDIARDVERLSELAQEGRLDLLRSGEEILGTSGLGDLPALLGETPLGDVPGKIAREEATARVTRAKALTF